MAYHRQKTDKHCLNEVLGRFHNVVLVAGKFMLVAGGMSGCRDPRPPTAFPSAMKAKLYFS